MDYIFKTIYFPRDRVRSGQATRVTVSLPTVDGPADPPGFVDYLASLGSAELREALGDRTLEDLEQMAAREDRSFSNECVRLIRESFVADTRGNEPRTGAITQASVPFGDAAPGVTFKESKRLPIFGWYPYVEGFSAPYVHEVVKRYGAGRSIYDPFGGSGTTQLAASVAGIPSWYSEVNPFMRFVADTKIEASRAARSNLERTDARLTEFQTRLTTELPQWASKVDLAGYHEAFPGRDFFVEGHIRELLGALDLAKEVAAEDEAVSSLLRLAVAANAVHASNMTRRADLRRRRADEYKTRVVDVPVMVGSSVERMLADLHQHSVNAAPTTFVSADCRQAPSQFDGAFELAITSPPYLNGTNYFRNTKIELWMLGFIASERELANFRGQAVAAGINNVNKKRREYRVFPDVESVAEQLDEQATDQRIPLLIRQYFSDMAEVMESVHRVLEPAGRFVFDIGDSKFYGVHVPTDHLLESIAETAGFAVESSTVLARRYSRDKSPLVQRELVFRKDA
ncbi:hypothetical protein ACFQHV_15830 [Promicromonospora thailandica]|uniref:site-specific DNA-methyltransferase (cytosine-N(4)-specific) n=1 Tax=Promicromonospora thailandica TaxID=765201 RepID=A0A9X2G7H0_9MICO|nr:hypothetical protein [Promicromonospora thailandica]MCP2264639.1 Methyltransferase domain [Promicromonospora thailandica]BFF20285.1 hypothetical protein GCM10025730_38060 [Promicromonospora thailandica]